MTVIAQTTRVAFDHIDVIIRDLESDRELDHGLFATWDEAGAEQFAIRRVDHFDARTHTEAPA